MAAQQPNGALLQPFPAPPNFYKHFTAENVASLLELQKEQPDAVSNPLTVREADPATDGPPILESKIPSELEYLIPPPPPTEGEYSAFGQTYLVRSTVGSSDSRLFLIPLAG